MKINITSLRHKKIINPEWEKLDDSHNILICQKDAFKPLNVGSPPRKPVDGLNRILGYKPSVKSSPSS